jgi:hypothetical protein
MMLGTRDWEGKGIFGDELEDLRLDLKGFPSGVLATDGDCSGEERGKGTAVKEWVGDILSRKGITSSSVDSESSSSLK